MRNRSILVILALSFYAYGETRHVTNPGTCEFLCVRESTTDDDGFHYQEVVNRCEKDQLCPLPSEPCQKDSIGKTASELCLKAECHIRFFRESGSGSGDCDSEELEPICADGKFCVDHSAKFTCKDGETQTTPGFCH